MDYTRGLLCRKTQPKLCTWPRVELVAAVRTALFIQKIQQTPFNNMKAQKTKAPMIGLRQGVDGVSHAVQLGGVILRHLDYVDLLAGCNPLGSVGTIDNKIADVVDGHEPGWRAVPVHDPVIQDAANHALKSIQERSNSLATYELLEIQHAKAEVIEESAKFDLLLKVRRGGKEEKYKVEVHRNLEGNFLLNQMQQEH
ncbi:Cysteine proteinase inhibitor 12 [Platanthera guangdongensis]|uniref:Cysteine proteinase inhibitor 12 n=1 Tax=Platanthera guangdongensis TaxID=2320717 RepID=A0ABR2MCR2_9ASPA